MPNGASSRPTVVFWGSKEQYRFVGAALANAGYIAVLPDYRLSPHARFPQFIDDGALALEERYLKKVGGSSSWVREWIALSAPYELKWFLPRVYTVFDASDPMQWRPIALVSDRAPPALTQVP